MNFSFNHVFLGLLNAHLTLEHLHIEDKILPKNMKDIFISIIFFSFRGRPRRNPLQDGLPVRGRDPRPHLHHRPQDQDHSGQLWQVQHRHLQQPRQDGPQCQLHGPLLHQGHEEEAGLSVCLCISSSVCVSLCIFGCS